MDSFRVISASFLIVFSIFAESADPSIKYEKLFRDAIYIQLIKQSAVDPDLKDYSSSERMELVKEQTEWFTRCHMVAMNAYSLDIQDAAFDIANSGGSYADAKAALNSAIAIEGAAGGDREKDVQRALKMAGSAMNHCLNNI